MPIVLALLLIAQTASGQQRLTSAEQRLKMFQENLAQRAEAITESSLTEIRTLEDWKNSRPKIRQQVLYMLGLDPLPAKTALRAKITGVLDRDRYRVEKVAFQSLPGLYVTGNLYVPKGGSKLPAVVYLCGHAPGPWGAKVQYQHHGIALASHGYVAFLIDTIEFGEIPGIHHGTHDLGMWNWLSMGYTPIGPEVWNAVRALDYLETRPEVDPKRIAVTGISGGGAISWYAAAADERFQVVSPVCATWSAKNQLAENSVVENCDCIYFHNTFMLDLSTVGALIAPRPLKPLSARRDEMFPQDGYHEVYRRLKPLYDLYGDSTRIAEYDYDTKHEDVVPFRKEAGEWINRWLKQDLTPFEEGAIHREEPTALAVLDGRPDDAINDHIQDTFIPLHQMQEWKTLSDWKQRKSNLVAEIKDKVFRAFPRTTVPFASIKNVERGWTSRYTDAWNVEFSTEENVRVTGQLFIPRDGRFTSEAVIFVKGTDDIVESVDYDLILPSLGKKVVLILKPRAVDYPLSNSGMATLKRSASLVGATVESMQVWDIFRTVDYLISDQNLKLSGISIYGRRHMGALGIYAAMLDERITKVILDDPPSSHRQGPALLNILRLTDLPEAAALIAPREVISLTPFPESFGYTEKIFALHGKKEAMHQANGLTKALQ